MWIKVTSLLVPLRQLPDWGLHVLPRFPLENPRAGHVRVLPTLLLSYPATAVSPAHPELQTVLFLVRMMPAIRT